MIGLAVEAELTKELLAGVKKVTSGATKAGALLMIELY